MKKILLLLLLISAGVQAQKFEFDLTPVNKRIDAVESRIKALESGTIVNPPGDLEKCKKGPTIVKVFNITSRGLTFEFDADNVTKMNVLVTGAKVHSEIVEPKKNTIDIVFPSEFPNGGYTISIDGVNCSGSNSRLFTIAGGVDPPSAGKCDPQPTFKINGFTSQTATIQFDANNLKTLKLSLYQIGEIEPIKSITYNPDVNTLLFPFGKILPTGKYKIVLTPVSCSAETRDQEFTIKEEGTGGVIIPPSSDPTLLGSYKTKAGGREYTFLGNEKFKLSFNPDGTISDATPGLDISGAINKLDGRNVFYMIGYSVFGDTKADYKKSYNKFQNIKLPDGIYLVKQIVTTGFNNIDNFIKDLDNGVNTDNSALSQIFLSINTDNATPNETNWLRASRKLIYPSLGIKFDADGTFGTSTINSGDNPLDYQKMGINTDLIFRDNGAPQPNTFRVLKWPGDRVQPTREELFRFGYGFAQQYGFNRNTIMYDEIPENTQGTDPNIDAKMPEVYRGALQFIREKDPNVDVKDTKLYGPYGVDDYNGTVSTRFLISQSRDVVLQALTDKVHYVRNGDGWPHPSSYYMDNHIDVRNINLNLYMYNSNWQLPYQLALTNERVKVGTKTWQGKDRERNWQAIAATGAQSLVMSVDGKREVGLEYSSTRDIIPYENGVIAAKNLATPAVWDELLVAGFYTNFLGGGISIWGGWNIGIDPTRFSKQYWYEQNVSWTKNGGSQETYVPGRNGAPLDSEPGKQGIEPSSQSTPTDGIYAGWLLAKSIKGRSVKISHAAYESSRGKAIPTPGQAGLHLNGFGPLNWGLMATKDLYDAHKGLMLVGEGPEGNVAVYYNGFLSQHETEEDLTLDFNGKKYNFGSVYGRKIYTFKF